ncbi:MAG: hypothetical protein ACYC6Y_23490 [Thermoguttaceae bacterium]
MPQVFSKYGISFLYPDNWALDEQAGEGEAESATVFSPGGAFWSVSVHPPSAEPKRLAEAAVEAMRAEYADLELEPTRQLLSGHKAHGFDLAFCYLDLTNSAFVRSFRTSRATYVLFHQAEDRELRQIEKVFEAITKSFLGSLE